MLLASTRARSTLVGATRISHAVDLPERGWIFGAAVVGEVTFARLQQAGVFSELAILFPGEREVHALLVDLGADRVRDIPRLPTMGATSPELYWRQICERIDNGMFAGFGLADLIAEALRRNPGNRLLRTLSGPADLRVLCLLAGPDALDQLRLRSEYQIILDAARQRGPRELIVTANPASRRNDIVREILAVRPDIVHFSGHGTSDGRLIFEEEDGSLGLVPATALASVLRLLPGGLSCVVLGSCYGGTYSDLLLGPARSVIGCLNALADDAALEFTRGFYTALAVGDPGMDTARAFDAGLAQMQIRGYGTEDMRFSANGAA